MRLIAPVLGLAALIAACGFVRRDAAADPAEPAGKVCLQIVRIGQTKILDDRTILFKMRDGQVWKNTLPFPCVGLKVENGFSYESRTDDICSNLQSIRVLRQGSVCLLGAFTPFDAPKQPG
jgi:hypothetical protein